MGISLKVIIYLITACVTLPVTGNKEGPVHSVNWDDIAAKTETYNAGASAHIKCSYPDNHENKEKFLCKGQNPLNCVKVIHTTEQDRDVDKGRFDIRDNRRLKYFYVNIRNLHTADSGTYWCGSDGTWQHDKYTKILLSVVNSAADTDLSKIARDSTENSYSDLSEDGSTEDTSADGSTKDTSADGPKNGIIGGVAGGLAFLLIVMVVLILFRHKLPWTQVCCAKGSSEQVTNTGHDIEGNPGDPHYEEIQASSRNTLPSVYAIVNPQADQLFYSSVTFQKDSVSVPTDGNSLPDTNKNGDGE